MPVGIEKRFLKGVEVRTDASGAKKIVGHAAVFNSMSENMGFYEVIEPGAFSNVLADPALDCRALFNHDPNFVLGRSTNGTLTLRQDDKGLYCEISLPDTSTIRDLVLAPIERGDINGMSFAFMVDSASWSDMHNGLPLRRIRSFSLLDDVCPVTYPAYPATSVQARSLLGDVPSKEEIQAMIAAEKTGEPVNIEVLRRRCDLREREFRMLNLN